MELRIARKKDKNTVSDTEPINALLLAINEWKPYFLIPLCPNIADANEKHTTKPVSAVFQLRAAWLSVGFAIMVG